LDLPALLPALAIMREIDRSSCTIIFAHSGNRRRVPCGG
jgi:hypothetical protein